MPTIVANSDAGVTYDLTVSKASGTTLTFNFFTNGVAQDVHLDTWDLYIDQPAGTHKVTLASGTGLTLSGSVITAVISVSNLSALTPFGGYSWSLVDTTAARTRINGNFLLNP